VSGETHLKELDETREDEKKSVLEIVSAKIQKLFSPRLPAYPPVVPTPIPPAHHASLSCFLLCAAPSLSFHSHFPSDRIPRHHRYLRSTVARSGGRAHGASRDGCVLLRFSPPGAWGSTSSSTVCFDPRPPGRIQGAGGGQPQCAAAGGPGSRRGPRGWPRPLPCAWARQRRSSLRRGWVGGGVCRGLPDAILADAAPLTVWRVASQRPGELPRRPVPRTLSSARLWSHPFH
jgi:hypothetical protein